MKKIDIDLIMMNLMLILFSLAFYIIALSAEASPNAWAQSQAICYYLTAATFIALLVMMDYEIFKNWRENK
jgi:uncharacterized membrane protein YcjF (UPF0283 family)